MSVNSHDPERLEIVNRRSFLFRAGVGAALVVIGGRLYQLQVIDHRKFIDLAEDNQFNARVIVPLRGEIVDRFGVPLASNSKHYRLLFIPEQTKDVDAALDEIGKIIELSPERRKRIKRHISRRAPFTPISIEDNLTWEEFSRVNFDLPYLSGAQPDIGETRFYPMGAASCFIV
ncbi:MAG: twin-arginine translocation signal domain-containing protein, partial [Parvularculaceae bacterium]|nr:twin-arginine translocation signal domain-containing protein [Parvularculaceae bacterium]